MPARASAEVLPTHTPELFQTAVRRAAELLQMGELVALPTETVYGLAANALDETAVAKIYEVKRRPARNPIIVHVASVTMAKRCVHYWPDLADKMATAFWPGPLTLVLPRSHLVPLAVTAGGDTVGMRWSSHPFIQAVIQTCGFPLAAPSANPSNQLSPTNAEHVRKALGDRIPLIIDGGQSQVGIESTVLDLNVTPPRVLRPGMIHVESLLAAMGGMDIQHLEPSIRSEGVIRSPGQLPKHYAPKARLVVFSWRDDEDLRSKLSSLNSQPKTTCVIAHTRIPLGEMAGQICVIPHDPEAFARAIYAELHRCDDQEATLIVVEAVPESDEWRAIRDRLRRAAGGG